MAEHPTPPTSAPAPPTAPAAPTPRPGTSILAVTSADRIKMFLAVIGTLLGVSVILVMIAILAHRAVTPPQVAGAKSAAERADILRAARASDHERLTTYGWMDRQKGIVRLPIEVAMEHYVRNPAPDPAATATSPTNP
jgi:hypothetical protein